MSFLNYKTKLVLKKAIKQIDLHKPSLLTAQCAWVISSYTKPWNPKGYYEKINSLKLLLLPESLLCKYSKWLITDREAVAVCLDCQPRLTEIKRSDSASKKGYSQRPKAAFSSDLGEATTQSLILTQLVKDWWSSTELMLYQQKIWPL